MTPYAGWGAYGASKAALLHMGRIWHEELAAHGVGVIAIDPGDMDTPLHAAALPDADPATLKAILGECGLDTDAILKASEGMAAKREAYTKHAIDQSVFGAPFFIIDGERFWGQDRIDFVERKLAS